MKFCACGRGCSNVLSIIRCNNNSRLGNTTLNDTSEAVVNISRPAPDIPKNLPATNSVSNENIAENSASQASPLASSPVGIFDDLLTSDSENSKSMSDMKNSFSSSNASFSLYSKRCSFNDSDSPCSPPFEAGMTEKLVGCTQHGNAFPVSSDSPANSIVTSTDPSQLPFSTPLLNHKCPNTCEVPSSLRRHFHNLSLRITPKDFGVDPPNHFSFAPEKASRSADDDEGLNQYTDKSDVSTDSFEALMARLRSSPPASSNKPGTHRDSSFIVSDDTSSETNSSDELSFYHRIENLDLKKSIKKSIKTRRRLVAVFESSDEEATEISLPGSSDHDESQIDKVPPLSPPTLLRNEGPPKSVKSNSLREGGNTHQDDVFSVLPFIYSLDSTDKPCFPSKNNRRRHPSAERFVRNFKKNREELANRLYTIYNEIVFDNKLPNDLRVQWNERLLKTAGQCLYMKRKVRSSDGTLTVSNEVKIELSGKVCTSAERVRDTLLHEACHAAVWLLHGVNDKHGRLWRAFVQRANNAFPGLPPVTVRHTYAIEARFIYRCTGCFATINRHSKSLDIQRKVCGRCKSRFQLYVKRNGKMIPVDTTPQSASSTKPGAGQPIVEMTPRSKPVFADFVKNHYKDVRGGVSSHKDAMNKLGNMFRSMRLNSDVDKEN